MPFSTSGNIRFWEFNIFKNHKEIRCVFSTRHQDNYIGGTGNFNLGYTRYADQENVNENRKILLEESGGTEDNRAIGKQIHSLNVRNIDSAGVYEETDALLTQTVGLSLIVSAADCLPIFLYDPENGAIGTVHSGWKGTKGGILTNAINLMGDLYGTSPSNLLCGVGPSIESACYEVGEEVAIQFDDEFLENSAEGKYQLDLKAAIFSQMQSAGVQSDNIEISDICNRCDADNFFSYRREGDKSGRMWGLIRLES